MEISSDELLRRKNTLKQFEDYFENITNSLNNFVEQIGWTPDKIPNNDILIKCPLNSEHRILPSKLEVHYEKCKLKKSGYDSTHSFYPSYNVSSSSSAQTIKIDDITQMQVLKSAYEDSNFTLNVKHEPREVSQSIERYVCDFTSDERRILYNYAVENTKIPYHEEVKNDITCVDLFNKNNEKPKTELELLQEQRDLKRRRAAYRGKRVHSDRKSYVEVLREVVEELTKSVSHQEDKSSNVEISNNIAETVLNNRFIYKYGGNRNYRGNPYTRWLGIEKEESKLSKDYERKSVSSHSNVSPEIYNLKDISDDRKSRGRRRSSDEFKYKRSRRSRSHSKFREPKYSKSKKSRTSSKSSKETFKRKSRSRSRSTPSKHKRSKKHKTRSKSRETTFKKSGSQSTSIETKHKQSKRHKTRSKSKESNSGKKLNVSKSPINCYKVTFSNEGQNSIEFNSTNSRNDHDKKKKHKHKRKHFKSSKKLHKDNDFEDC